MMFDDLEMFLVWYLNNRPIAPPYETSLHRYRGLHSAVIYRQAPYQVELYIVDPHTEVPDHMHPNVDSFEVFLCGDVHFRHSGKVITPPKLVSQVSNGVHSLLGQHIRVHPNDSHGATIGYRGGMFLSVQKWLAGAPTSVGKNWIATESNEAFNKDILQ